ncbi:MAG: hypothetical protein O3C51_12405 [Planctomycetota bacterium]|nr:hypothetical protein [Planctomycetota bacterium]MDA1220578.1 hypothetical protein [Planctomycetota bacterium]
MVLAAAVGKLVGDQLGLRDGLVLGLIAGIVLAPLVPRKRASCPTPGPSAPADRPH